MHHNPGLLSHHEGPVIRPIPKADAKSNVHILELRQRYLFIDGNHVWQCLGVDGISRC